MSEKSSMAVRDSPAPPLEADRIRPQCEAGHECTLAGTGGVKWTDDEAKKIAADSSINQDVTYLGQFLLNSTKGEVMSDSCHASSPTGEDALGKQAMAFFGG